MPKIFRKYSDCVPSGTWCFFLKEMDVCMVLCNIKRSLWLPLWLLALSKLGILIKVNYYIQLLFHLDDTRIFKQISMLFAKILTSKWKIRISAFWIQAMNCRPWRPFGGCPQCVFFHTFECLICIYTLQQLLRLL